MKESGHRFLDHTADIAIEVWGTTEEELLLEAARTIVEIITEGAGVSPDIERDVIIEAMDAEDRLVQWLNEVLWLAIGEGFVLSDGDIALTGDGLHATVRGEADGADLIVTEIKSATYHDLQLARDPSGRYVARVVLDV